MPTMSLPLHPSLLTSMRAPAWPGMPSVGSSWGPSAPGEPPQMGIQEPMPPPKPGMPQPGQPFPWPQPRANVGQPTWAPGGNGDLSAPLGSPDVLGALRPGGAPANPNPNPYQGTNNPGMYAQPAPFNPLLAQTLLARLGGGMGGQSMGGPVFGRGPLGSFGATPESERPRAQRPNPYRGGR